MLMARGVLPSDLQARGLCGIPRESHRKTAGPGSGQTGFDVSREPIRQIETKAPERIKASDEIQAMRESA
jgi:hypothetical protein